MSEKIPKIPEFHASFTKRLSYPGKIVSDAGGAPTAKVSHLRLLAKASGERKRKLSFYGFHDERNECRIRFTRVAAAERVAKRARSRRENGP